MSQLSALSSSSPHLNSHHPPRSSNPSPPPDSATDPAQLLRQAALSSRKLKRRKLDASASGVSLSRPLSRSIASTPSISLDYGQEEPSSPPTTSRQPPPAQTPARAPTPAQTFPPGSPSRDIKRDDSTEPPPQTPLDDDASMREEGEISENEDPPFRPPSQSMSAPITVAGVKYADMAPGTVRSPPFGVMSRSPSVMVEDAYQHVNPASTPARLPSIEGQPPALSARPPLSESFRLETPNYVLDPDHVRPGLTLTQKQYDTAKGVILDILGYGVPPEYLIDCGISKEIIYYVFTELNLRLPSNLVTRGIHPYPPPLDVIESILRSQSGYALSPLAAVFPTADDDITRPGSVEHRNLSPGPPTPHDSTSTATPQVATTEFIDNSLSASVLALSESTLTAIERQRKQELLARKAVQASRKRKESVPLSLAQSSTGTPSAGPDISATSSASAVSVEDFFNSIELPPSDTADPERDPDEVKAPELVKQSSPEPMSVDEGIPGFGLNTASEYDYPIPRASVGASLRRSTSAENWNALVEREKEVPAHKTSQGPGNLPTRSRSDGVLAPHLAKDSEGDSRRSPQPTAPIPRRGAKRPVAADFDSEPIPKGYTPPGGLSRTGSGTGFSNGGGYHPNPHVRRKMNGVMAGGFASLNSARRCVIDVSDSEEETSGDEMPSTASAPRGARPQGAASGGTQSSAGDSALALELEIERMRKIIREREEMKLRKDAVRGNRFASCRVCGDDGWAEQMASSRATPVSRESPAMCRSAEGEGEASEMAALSSRSETGNDKASKNVLAAPSSPPRLDVNCPSPISSTPSPPSFPPLSPSRDGTNARTATHSTTFTDQSATPADDERAIGGPALAAEPRPESAASSRASTPPQATWPVLHRHSPETGQSVDIIASVQVRFKFFPSLRFRSMRGRCFLLRWC
ncbi:hypothetical protein BC827DRAFT_1160574 [Russula dissimulans]|nr:hypothetical protein BC827DRAFT_1160574 [Russula dissimulans]